jgi:DNA-3-methyladenine glycosylase
MAADSAGCRLGPPGALAKLPLAFFARPTLRVARDLLGRYLVRRLDGTLAVARIVETEAYVGDADRACHASRGRTPRNDPLYRRPGTLYVYFTYGMHWLVNVVTEREGFPAAVLLRAAEPFAGLDSIRRRRPGRPDRDLLRGPASLARGLGIDGRLNGVLARGGELWIARGEPVRASEVRVTPRVGVEYAGDAKDYPWRFLVASSPSVSASRPSPRGTSLGRPA